MGLHTRGGGRVPCVIPDHPRGAGICGPGRVPVLGRRGRGPDPRVGGGQAGLPRPCGAVGGRWGGWVLWPPGPISGAHRVGLRRRGCRAPRPGPGPQGADRRPLTTALGKPPAPPPPPPEQLRGPGEGVTTWVTASRLSSPQPGPPRVAPGAAPPPSPSRECPARSAFALPATGWFYDA